MEKKIRERVERAIKEKVFPGCVVGAYVSGQTKIFPFGRFTYDKDSENILEDTVYDIASVTKMIPLASSVLYLADQGKIALEDRVVNYLPEFGNSPGKEKVLIKHLLTYTLDIDVPSTTSLKEKSSEEIIRTMLKAPLKSEPGRRPIYTNSTALIMGLLFSKVSEKPLNEFAEEYFFKPLGMRRTTFYPEDLRKDSIPPTEYDDWRGRIVRGEVHDEATFTLQKDGYYLGVSGLFSNVPDLLIFMKMLLNKGIYNGRRYFSEEIVKQMHTNQLPGGEKEFGLGWDLNSKPQMGDLSSNQSFGHRGFTGTMVMCDPVKNVAIVILSNRTYPKRPLNGDAINSLRRDVVDIIFKDV